MKTIMLHGIAPDNAGDHHPAGTTLTVDDNGREGCITSDRAKHLVAIHSATVVLDEKKASPKTDE